MAWIRLSDDYMSDEKIQALSDGAFRLWHEALAHCRRHQTDGLIPFTVMKHLMAFTKSREKQLSTPCRDGLAPLWELIPATGYKVHNYLAWNPSKDEENERRADSKTRMQQLREQRKSKGVAPPGSPPVSTNISSCSHKVLGLDTEQERKILPNEEIRARSKRPIFTGQRLTVFEWMLDNCLKTLGPLADAFDLHAWFFDLDALAARTHLVIPQRDNGAWLHARLLEECTRRGLPMASAPVLGKQTTRLAAALANIKAEAG